jgi:hypothetical protein
LDGLMPCSWDATTAHPCTQQRRHACILSFSQSIVTRGTSAWHESAFHATRGLAPSYESYDSQRDSRKVHRPDPCSYKEYRNRSAHRCASIVEPLSWGVRTAGTTRTPVHRYMKETHRSTQAWQSRLRHCNTVAFVIALRSLVAPGVPDVSFISCGATLVQSLLAPDSTS